MKEIWEKKIQSEAATYADTRINPYIYFTFAICSFFRSYANFSSIWMSTEHRIVGIRALTIKTPYGGNITHTHLTLHIGFASLMRILAQKIIPVQVLIFQSKQTLRNGEEGMQKEPKKQID